MGVLNGSNRLNFPFFYALPPPLGPRNPPGRARVAVLGALIPLPSSRFGPIRRHFGPYRSTLWPIRGSALLGVLIDVPSGRFGPIRADSSSFWALNDVPFGRFSASSQLRTLIHVPFGRFGA